MSIVVAWRQRQGMSRAELARRAGLKADTVHRFERCLGNTTFTARQKLADAIGVNVADLYRRAESDEREHGSFFVEEDRGHETPCWIWRGSLLNNGYGCVGIRDATRSTHRVFYEAMRGLVDEGRELHHLCEQRACCNPYHLRPVTKSEHALITGVWNRALADWQVRAIRRAHEECGFSGKHFARLFKVDPTLMQNVIYGRSYRDVV